MYTNRVFPLAGLLKWTRRYIYMFLIISLVPVLLFDVFHWKWLHLPWVPIGLLGTAVAFMQGFKNNASYDRLWEARKIWGGIVNTSRTFTIMIKDFITNDFTEDKISTNELKSIHRELVHRHVAWLTALRHQMRMDKPWEDHLKTVQSNIEFRKSFDVPEDIVSMEDDLQGYISKEEISEVLAKGNQASQLLGIQSRRLKELKQSDLIEDFRHMEFVNVLKELYTLQGKSERIKIFPYPRQFATLNHYFVWIFIILLPFGIMDAFEGIGSTYVNEMTQHAHDNTEGFFHGILHFMGNHFVWLSIPFSAMISWVFYTLELIGENTENPFEGGPNDVPISNMSRGIEIDIRQLIDDTNIPAAREWRNDIVM